MTGVVNSVSNLADDQPADDRDAERLAQFGTGPGPQHQRQRAEHRRHGRHQNRPETKQAGLINRLTRRQSLDALGLQREVDHHDRIFLDDADEQNDADDGDDVEVVVQQHQRQKRADARRRQRRKNSDRMDEAFVEDAQHDVHRDDGREEQEYLVGQRRLKGRRGALERGGEADGKADFFFGLLDGVHRRAK